MHKDMNKNIQNLKKELSGENYKRAFASLLALREFLAMCIVPKDFKPRNGLAEAISLTPAGEEWASKINTKFEGISQSEVHLALFVRLFCQDILIDVLATNFEKVIKFLHSSIIGDVIKYPWVYGRDLYDRFYEMFPNADERLSNDETLKLLENTSQGVFQLTNMVIGPFGILPSSCDRYLPPVRTVPLWHCPDPSCTAIHPVVLSTGSTQISEVINFISTDNDEDELPETSSVFFRNVLNRQDYYEDMLIEGFPWLLVNGFSHGELKIILSRLIDCYKEIRARFPNNKRFRGLLTGSGADIVEKLSKPQCFQLILLISDNEIINCIELLIKEGLINIPPTELRKESLTYGSKGWFSVSWECSQFGIRSVSTKEDISFARLKRLIEQLYLDEEIKQIEWKLRLIQGNNIREKIDAYIHSEEPKQIVRNMILDSEEHLKQSLDKLKYGMFIIPPSKEEEDDFINKILWKLGFDIRLYPSYEQLFWNRLGKLLETATCYSSYDENIKELIRSAGVNFFVSLEEVLDHSLSFITWALVSDHYGVTKFRCDINEAREFMASHLNGRQLGSNEPIQLDASGKNTLYPLIQGFAILAELCNEIVNDDWKKYARQKNEIPRYHGRTELELFPFLHTIFVLDLTRQDYERIKNLLKNITEALETSQICDIRNRLEHKRADFPDQTEIKTACEKVKNVINEMEEYSIIPLIYFYSGRRIDEYGRGMVSFKNYKDRDISIEIPTQLRACRLPPISLPLIICPIIRIGDTTTPIHFQFEEMSEYKIMWQDYPKRRRAYPGFEETE